MLLYTMQTACAERRVRAALTAMRRVRSARQGVRRRRKRPVPAVLPQEFI